MTARTQSCTTAAITGRQTSFADAYTTVHPVAPANDAASAPAVAMLTADANAGKVADYRSRAVAHPTEVKMTYTRQVKQIINAEFNVQI